MEANNQRIGLLLMTAIAIIVGLVLLTGSAQNLSDAVHTENLANRSMGAVAVNNALFYFRDCRALANVVVFNATGGVAVETGNYTVVNEALDTSGNLVSYINPTISITPSVGWNKGTWTVDAVCSPTGYITDSGARAVAGVILVLFAVALVVVMLYPTLKEKFF